MTTDDLTLLVAQYARAEITDAAFLARLDVLEAQWLERARADREESEAALVRTRRALERISGL